ncbi:LD-carboxypeptidase [Segetibacter sp. 3557_3]|nr:LD-carboxypeptidase [Segetibacter sp. 3557_3]
MISHRGFSRNTVPDFPVALPPNLKAGDTIGITCPAGFVTPEKILNCAAILKNWGFRVCYGNTVGKQWMRFGGTDRERLEDFQTLLDDDNIHAVLFGKGGYGTMRIIDQVNWEKFREKPKWLIGYSDLTTVHLHVQANLGIPTLHGDMVTGMSGDYDRSSSTLFDALHGIPLQYAFRGSAMNRPGFATATLVGGNLSMIAACAGSKSDINTAGKILFIEEVSEYKYTIDRMLLNLKRSGKLDKLAGLILGGFTAVKVDQEETFQMSVEEIVYEKVREYGYPVCFNFPAGHMKDNCALKLGVPHELTVNQKEVTLVEIPQPLVSG